jgi:hypothetical protein
MKRDRTISNEIDLGQSSLKFSALKVAGGYWFFINYSLHFYCDISMTFINKIFLSSGGVRHEKKFKKSSKKDRSNKK